MSGLSLKCASRTKSIGQSEFAASSPSLFERAQFVGWVERLVRRSSTSEGGSDVNQLLPGTVMGFAALYPSCEVCDFCPRASSRTQAGAIQNCCSVKTVTAIPARSRSSTLCKSSMPAPTLSAVCIPWRCWCPSRAKSTATEGLRICRSIRVGSVQKNSVHQCWHEPCIG